MIFKRARRESERGYALLALIIAMMVILIWASSAALDVKTQAQRSREIEAYARGQHIAEGIARYYAGGKLPLQGLSVNLAQPPRYGWLLDLKKLREGLIIRNREVHFARASAFVDPLTNQEWEPIRIGDPRIRKFLLAWSKATQRPIPPLYMQFMGAQRISLDEIDEFGNPVAPKEGSSNLPGAGPSPNGDASGDDDDDEDDDEDFEDDDSDDDSDDEDDGEFEDDDPGDGSDDGAKMLSPVDSPFVVIAFQDSEDEPGEPATPEGDKPGAPTNANTNAPKAQPTNPFARSPFGRRLSNAPIIGVVSKSKGSAIRTVWGLEKHGEILFIYMPNLPIGPQQATPQGIIDQDGDGRDDRFNRATGTPGPTGTTSP
jgi:type II secretory pathway pseudopilin PulG